MALAGLTFDPIRAYGKERVFLSLQIKVGATGAVAAVDGKGWKHDGSEGVVPYEGSVTRQAAGTYKIVLPGGGAVPGLHVVSVLVDDAGGAGATEARNVLIHADPSTRSVTVKLVTLGDTSTDPAIADLTSGSKLHVTLMVMNSPL